MASFDPNAQSQINIDPPLTPRQKARTSEQSDLEQALIEQGYDPLAARELAATLVVRADWDRQSAEYDAANPGWREKGNAEVRAGYDAENPTADMSDIDTLLGRKWTGTSYDKTRPMGPMGESPDFGRRIPGPRNVQGKPVSPGDAFPTADAAAAYDDRAVDPATGRLLPSQLDQDFAARGMQPVYGPGGEVGYSVSADANPDFPELPGAPGRPGYRPDLVAAGYSEQGVLGPPAWFQVYTANRTGNVQAPGTTASAGDRQDRYKNDRMMARLRANSGMDPKDAAKVTDASQLRQAGMLKREMDKQDRQKLVVQRAQLQQNPMAFLGDQSGVNDWQRMVAADQMLRRGFTGPTPLGVEALNAEQAGKMAQSAMTAFLTNNPAGGPLAQVQAQLAQQQADSGKPVALRAQEHVAAGNLRHPDVLQHADDIVHNQYSSRPGMLGVSSQFTDNEVMLAAQQLADETGMSVAQAETIMRRVQQNRNRNSVASTVVAGFYDQ